MNDLERRVRQALLDARQALALGDPGTLADELAALRSEVLAAQCSDEERRRLLELCDAGLKRVGWATKRTGRTLPQQ
ncbi:hypothetical protein [Nocardia huaxiensis]|uniref:hypothetical protein n=1 Tax=Nocardia huaxiensis TaxID=2755382 RepID=UPI001E3A709A|nr:hypothetical protein [Nocardia huaxiensis]UFS98468.1 hypothetical protein LPY97_11470 [Nocardia huaxiensis]